MIEIIPAIDLIDGACVRLERGEFENCKQYDSDPLSAAQRFEAAGLKRLHLVDLDGARAGSPRNLGVLERIAAKTSLRIDISGGLRRREDLELAFQAGAALAAVGSAAVKEPEQFAEWLSAFGPERLILAADNRDGKVAIAGWTEAAPCLLIDFLDTWTARGVRQVLCTDISKDGMLAGPAFELYTNIMGRVPHVQLIASGGVACLEDIERLDRLGVHGVVVGKALYEGLISLAELERFSC